MEEALNKRERERRKSEEGGVGWSEKIIITIIRVIMIVSGVLFLVCLPNTFKSFPIPTAKVKQW